MKNTLYSLAFLMALSCILFTACGPSKKLKASRAQVNQLKKDSIEARKKNDEKNAVDKNTADKTTSTTPLSTYDTKSYIPLPPDAVDNNFKSKYPAATQIVWTKRMPLVKTKTKNAMDYKATFVIEKNNNSVIYSENGVLIERREQIAPDQLPPNIYDAITKKYPKATIVSATNFKNLKLNGAYTAIIKPKEQSQEIEVILTENGTFVE
jgi:hypothetical protein